VARSFAALTCLLFLALTTPATDLIVGLRRLGLPAEIAEIALLMYRFLFLLGDTAMAMDSAQAARLGHFGAKRRLRSLGLLIANLLPRALGRARRLEVGLAARGWNGEMRVLSKRTKTSMPALGLVLLVEAAIAATGIYLS
jgi:cobalt/nickel transport system permease protein